MAKNIAQRISLEGGADFKAQLKSLGDAGVQAFGAVTDATKTATNAAIAMAPTVDAIQKKFGDLKNAANEVKNKFSEAGSKFREAGERLTVIAGIVLGAEGGFAALIISSARAADEIVKSAAAAGIATDKFQNMRNALGVAGIEINDVAGLLNKMNKSFGAQIKSDLDLSKAQSDLTLQYGKGKISIEDYVEQNQKLIKDNNEQINAFTRLGINAKEALNDPHEALLQLIDAFSKLPEGIAKSSLEIEIFGRNGTKFAAVANEGREAFEALEKEMARIAPPLSKIELKIGSNLKDAFEKLVASMDSTRLHFFNLFAPATQRVVDSLTEAVVRNRGAFLDFGAAVIEAMRPLIAQVIEFVDNFKIDPQTFTAIITSIAQFARDTVQAIKILIAGWEGFVAVMQVVADGINKIFGTNFSGQALAIVAIVGVVTGVFSAMAAAIGAVISVIALLATAFGGINLAIAAVGLAIGFIFGQGLIDAVSKAPAILQAVLDAINAGWLGTVNNFKNLWADAINFLSTKWDEFKNFILQSLPNLGARIRNALSTNGSADGVSRAGGGMVRGPGTATSDSIRAWLSDGEFVVKARAVKHYGADLFAALNQMRIPSPGFAMGGIVSSMDSILPRRGFAEGGLVGMVAQGGPSGRPVILKIGEQSFGPMTADDDTVTRLERFAAGKQIRSAGRKPTWMK